MSKRLNEARTERIQALRTLREMHEKAEVEKRAFTPGETTLFNGLTGQAERLAREIDDLEAEQRAQGISTQAEILAAFNGQGRGSVANAGEQRAFVDTTTGRTVPVLGREDGRAGIEAKLREHYRNIGKGDAFHLEAGEQASWRDFLRAVAGQKSSPWAQRALSIGTDSAGGWTVPTALLPGLLDALFAQSSMLAAGTRLVPLDDGAKTHSIAAINALPNAAWRLEAGAVAESDPVFRAITLTPRSLSFRFKVSRELLADSANFDNAAIARVMAQAFGVAMDLAGLRGSGTAPTPRGILNVAGINAVANGANGATQSSLRWSNLLAAYQAILTANAPAPTAAIMAPRSLIGYASLADSTAQPLRRPDLLEPVRFIQTSQIPVNLTVGTSTDCTEVYVGDFARSFWGVREAPSLLVDPYSASTTGEVQFVCHWRGDFAVEYASAFAVITGVRAN
jgi:HK97 family phage major capsid protein